MEVHYNKSRQTLTLVFEMVYGGLYASSCCDSANVSSSLPIVEMDAKPRNAANNSQSTSLERVLMQRAFCEWVC